MAACQELPREVLALARNCALEARDGERWELVVAPGSDILLRDTVTAALTAAVSARAGVAVQLVFVNRPLLGETPRQTGERHQRERLATAEQTIRADENIRDLQQIFEARLLPGSIKPID